MSFDKKNFRMLIVLAVLLVLCILLMGIAVLISAKAFARVSSYIAIACVVITLVGLVVIVRSNAKHKK